MKIRTASGFCSSIILYVGAVCALSVMAGCSADGGSGGSGNTSSSGNGNGNPGGGNFGSGGAPNFGGNGSGNFTSGGGQNGNAGSLGTAGGFAQGGVSSGGNGTGFGGASGGVTGTGGANTGGVTGYFTSGTWKGFGFTSTFGTAMISPPNFAGVATWPMCVTGNVPASATGANGALVGWNVNQASTANAPIGTVMKSQTGITVGITNRSNTQLRLQLQGPTGATVATDRWCAEIGATTSNNIFVPYETFNTECWPGGKGVAYKGEPIAQVIVQVPSTAAPQTFDFCVNNIAEGTSGTGGGMGCDLNAKVSGTALSGSLAPANAFQRVSTNTGSPQIMVQNNVFGGGGGYTLNYSGASFTLANFTGSKPTNGTPIGYPSLFIGSNGGNGQATTGSNLAKQVSTITSIPTALRWSGTGTEFNIAYDVWFAPGAGDAGPGSRSFLMVWFHRTANVFAEGQGNMHSGGPYTVGSKTFNTYVSRQFEGRPIISYVAASTISEWSFNLADFIRDAKTRTSSFQTTPVITDSMYLTNVFAGSEVWSGVSNLAINNFCIQVQ